MPTTNVRYGRPKGSGLDDRRQLETLAALLVANPKLKPTTAIRSLGVEDPSTIRRLREKFRVEQAKLMADAHRSPRSTNVRALRITTNESTRVSELPSSRALVPVAAQATAVAALAPAHALLLGWCDVAFCMLSAAAEAQAALTEQWLALPPVGAAVRRQLAVGSVAVAVYTRSKGRRRILH
jgi:hypothetical protein